MGRRTIKSFNSWEEAEMDDLEERRKTTPEQRIDILLELIALAEQLPKQQMEEEDTTVNVLVRSKKA